MNTPNYKLTKRSCYFAYVAAASVFVMPPMLFATFHETYGISYTLLGTLVLINFFTQLSIDLIFSFFTKLFNVKLTARIMPLITSLGLLIYALVPHFAPEYAYTGLVIGTIVFSIAAGLGEVLISPIVAAVPSETPDRDMSFLHSLYAWGVLLVVGITTLFIKLFGTERWLYLALLFAALPIISAILFFISPIPDMDLTSKDTEHKAARGRGLILCFFCIFLGSAAENVMTNWISVYMETALSIPKAIGDILGLALFAILLGLGRTLYAKYGKNIGKVLLFGMAASAILYVIVGLSPSFVLAMIACVLVGLSSSMLWPGTLILMEENFPSPGVAAYALMAAGGDFGASIAPQLLGIIVDTVSASSAAARIGESLSLSAEQVGMKCGMLTAALFPIIGTVLLIFINKYFKKSRVAQASPLEGE